MDVDPELYAQALADLRATRTTPRQPPAAPQVAPSDCCAGDRAGYQRHRWHGEEPCAASRQANTDYWRTWAATTPGVRERRARRERDRRRGVLPSTPTGNRASTTPKEF